MVLNSGLHWRSRLPTRFPFWMPRNLFLAYTEMVEGPIYRLELRLLSHLETKRRVISLDLRLCTDTRTSLTCCTVCGDYCTRRSQAAVTARSLC